MQGVPSLRLGSDHVLLDFDGPDPLSPRSRPAVAEVQRLGDAPLTTTPSGDGTRGLVFPGYRTSGEQRLVLLLRRGPSGGAGATAPDLVFGADVELTGHGEGPEDDGDNVVQRGLYADENQFKLQVDRGVPSCTVRTPRMRAFTALADGLGTGWHRLSCHYDGVTLELRATRFDGSTPDDRTASTRAPAGALSFATSTAISVGGKVTATGALVESQPDQLNGALDNVYVSSRP